MYLDDRTYNPYKDSEFIDIVKKELNRERDTYIAFNRSYQEQFTKFAKSNRYDFVSEDINGRNLNIVQLVLKVKKFNKFNYPKWGI